MRRPSRHGTPSSQTLEVAIAESAQRVWGGQRTFLISLSEADRGTPRTPYRSASIRTFAVGMRCCCGETAACVQALTLLARAGTLGATKAALAAAALLPKRLLRCVCGCACGSAGCGEPLTKAARRSTAKRRMAEEAI